MSYDGKGKSFRKHKEVRSALNRDYIKTNKIGIEWGKHYDWLFDNRQKLIIGLLSSSSQNRLNILLVRVGHLCRK